MKAKTKTKTIDIDWDRLRTGNPLWSRKWQEAYLARGYSRDYFELALLIVGSGFTEYLREPERIQGLIDSRIEEINYWAVLKGLTING